jgi:hypothetical protein
LVQGLNGGVVFEVGAFLGEERLVSNEVAVDTKGDFSEIAFKKY